MAEQNGVAVTLRLMHQEVKGRDLPIDFVVASDKLEPDDHLHVLRPVATFTTPIYKQQPLNLLDLVELERLFATGGYDRIICSTELTMGLAALYLKHAFHVPATFFVHTDWLDFCKRTLRLEPRHLDRVRRMLRAFYRSFDSLLVLNQDHLDWLSGASMGIPRERLALTRHWVDDVFRPQPVLRSRILTGVTEQDRVILYSGRLSEEKGVMELPLLMDRVRAEVPRCRLVIAGSGPMEERLRAAMPDAPFLGWVEPQELARVYSAADLLVLPSRFDTFGCVVLEALSCGLPVLAHANKGPKDIIQHGRCGLLSRDRHEMARNAVRLLTEPELHHSMRRSALERAREFRAERILPDFLSRLGLSLTPSASKQSAPPRPLDLAI